MIDINEKSIPVKTYEVRKIIKKDGFELKGDLVGYEYEADKIPTRDGIPNILLDPQSPWREIFKADYRNQPYTSRETEQYVIPTVLNEYLGVWEGFVTSFIWRKIQFKNVFVQLVIGETYLLPIELIQQIQDKIDIKCSKLDPVKAGLIDTKAQWGQAENTDLTKNLFKEKLDFYGKVN